MTRTPAEEIAADERTRVGFYGVSASRGDRATLRLILGLCAREVEYWEERVAEAKPDVLPRSHQWIRRLLLARKAHALIAEMLRTAGGRPYRQPG